MLRNYFKSLPQASSLSANIYALCDFDMLNKHDITLEQYVQICKSNGVKLVQYRDKTNSIEIQKLHLNYLTSHLDVPIIINDKLELVEYAHGLHVGQEDLERFFADKSKAVMLLRKKLKDKLLGVSTHNELEILQANEWDLDYIGLGAYKNTSTKDVSTVLGDKLPYLAKVSKHPVCAIGGVKKEDVLANVSMNVIGSGLLS